MKELYHIILPDKTIIVSEKLKTAVHKAIIRLPDDQQKVLRLYYEKHLSIKEIALQLDYSCTSIYNKHYRALHALKLEFNPAAFAKINHILYGQIN